MAGKGRVIILGMMGRTPFAGVAWQVLHYLEGLRRLGHDVSYVEDTGDWPYDPEQNSITDDCTYTIRYTSAGSWTGAVWASAGPTGRRRGGAPTSARWRRGRTGCSRKPTRW